MDTSDDDSDAEGNDMGGAAQDEDDDDVAEDDDADAVQDPWRRPRMPRVAAAAPQRLGRADGAPGPHAVVIADEDVRARRAAALSRGARMVADAPLTVPPPPVASTMLIDPTERDRCVRASAYLGHG
jgi:hypothetical protein